MIILASTLLFIVAASFATLWWADTDANNLKEVLQILLAPVSTLVGVTVTFYFTHHEQTRQ